LLVAGLSAAGCARDLPEPTFNKDIAPIVFANCASCHRPGGAAPFSLLTYADVSSRADNARGCPRGGSCPSSATGACARS
jgi:hypothetical protein